MFFFHYEKISQQEVKHRILSEAVELLSLPALDIEMDYQIFSVSEENVDGIFSCILKTLLLKYLKVVEDAQLVPMLMIPEILANVTAFMARQKNSTERCLFLNFSDDKNIQLAVLNAGRCELVRQLVYENRDETLNEIVLSIRRASARSAQKVLDRIYLTGNINVSGDFAQPLHQSCHAEVISQGPIDLKAALRARQNIFNINLGRHFVFARERRETLLKISLVLFAGVMMLAVFNAWRIGFNFVMLKDFKSSYSQGDYQHALSLQKKMQEKGYVP